MLTKKQALKPHIIIQKRREYIKHTIEVNVKKKEEEEEEKKKDGKQQLAGKFGMGNLHSTKSSQHIYSKILKNTPVFCWL